MTADRLPSAPPPVNGLETHKYAATPAALAAKILAGEAWLVDGLLQQRQKRNGLQFLVQWAGEYESIWEPRANIPEELISRYFAQQQDPHSDDTTAARTKKRPTALPPGSSPILVTPFFPFLLCFARLHVRMNAASIPPLHHLPTSFSYLLPNVDVFFDAAPITSIPPLLRCAALR